MTDTEKNHSIYRALIALHAEKETSNFVPFELTLELIICVAATVGYDF